MRLLPLPLSILLTAAAALSAQQPPAPEPQFNADSTVTFHYAAPTAAKAALALEGTRIPLPMEREASSGLWTVTTPVLPPEIYSYHFEVDGLAALDPLNPSLKASYTSAGNSFLVPGTPARPWELNAVPHGTVHHHVFTTHVVLGLSGGQDEFYVYTPPGYDPRAATRYPVFYLLHGWSDTAAGWLTVGHANDILDNLIAQGKARPMIVVMPLGYGDMSFVRSGSDVWNQPNTIDHNTALFTRSLLTEILPQVDRLYLTARGPSNRAIAGLSMGGLESLTIGLTHPELFSYVGGFSAAVHQLKPSALPVTTPQPKLLWIACGTSDDLIEPNRRLIAALSAEGDKPIAIETPGMHTWLVWRDNLVTFAPLLFQPSARSGRP